MPVDRRPPNCDGGTDQRGRFQRAESLDDFLVESGLHQWNTKRVIPSQTVAEAMSELAGGHDAPVTV